MALLDDRTSFQTWTEVSALAAHMAAVERRLLEDGGEEGKEIAQKIVNLRFDLQTSFDINITERS